MRATKPKMPKMIGGFPIVKREAEASCVYDTVENTVIDFAPGVYWSLATSKAQRERGTGHKCVYLGWPSRLAQLKNAEVQNP